MKTMMTAKANAIHERLNEVGEGVGFDPLTIIGIIMAVMKLFQNCDLSPDKTRQRMANPSRFDLFVLRREIVRHTSRRANRAALEAAILDECDNLTDAEVSVLYEDAK